MLDISKSEHDKTEVERTFDLQLHAYVYTNIPTVPNIH